MDGPQHGCGRGKIAGGYLANHGRDTDPGRAHAFAGTFAVADVFAEQQFDRHAPRILDLVGAGLDVTVVDAMQQRVDFVLGKEIGIRHGYCSTN